MVRFLAWLNAVFSLLCALAGAAPFTGAPVAFTVTLPAAALMLGRGGKRPAGIVVATWVLAIWLSPIRWGQLLEYPIVIWFAGVSLCAGWIFARILFLRGR